MMKTRRLLAVFSLAVLLGVSPLLPERAAAHCDTLDGPVVQDARTALDQGKVTPVLKWVQPKDEGEITAAFDQAMKVRKLGPEAQKLADQYFFETLVRVHRAAEGAPYTGLKPAGQVAPAIALADQALAKGSADALVGKILEHTEEGIRHRFQRTLEAKKKAGESVEAGRRYVENYVDYTHYVEAIAELAHAEPGHGKEEHGH